MRNGGTEEERNEGREGKRKAMMDKEWKKSEIEEHTGHCKKNFGSKAKSQKTLKIRHIYFRGTDSTALGCCFCGGGGYCCCCFCCCFRC